LVIAPLRGELQSHGIQVVHRGDVLLPAPQARLVNPTVRTALMSPSPCLRNVELNASPQWLVSANASR
jgi:hypothetical protein